MTCTIQPRRSRRGSILLEGTIALAMIAVAAVLLTQVAALAAGQRRLANQRRLALEELTNRMERAALLPWDQLSAESIEQIPLRDEVRQSFLEAKLTAAVTDEPGVVASRRISLSLAWKNSAGVETKPVTLSAWRFKGDRP